MRAKSQSSSEKAPFHVHLIRLELEQRKIKNPRYSLRAFSRSLGINPGTLSAILRQKRPVSPSWCERLIERLGLLAKEAAMFRHSVLETLQEHKVKELEAWTQERTHRDTDPREDFKSWETRSTQKLA